MKIEENVMFADNKPFWVTVQMSLSYQDWRKLRESKTFRKLQRKKKTTKNDIK